jgi:hypothetical protein
MPVNLLLNEMSRGQWSKALLVPSAADYDLGPHDEAISMAGVMLSKSPKSD